VLIQVSNPLNSSALTFPVLECFHIVGFAVAIGTIAILDFRLLGFGMRRQTSAELARDLAPWTLGGLFVTICAGLLLYTSDPDMYYLNISFLIKMVCLLAAIVFNYTIHRKVAASATSSRGLVACISLLLWASVIFGGIFIAFVEGGL
jgi:hypothetical protein